MIITFISLTNKGYIPFTLNCIESLKLINSEYKLNCYCIDVDSYNILNECYDNDLVHKIQNQTYSNKELQTFREGNWKEVVVNKFNIIYYNLLKYEYVLFSDGDIVFERDGFVQYCYNMIRQNDMDLLLQTDYINRDNSIRACSGFMFIKSNSKTKSLFDPSKINMHDFECDQIYINNKIKHNTNDIRCGYLPQDLFPNGKYYYDNSKIIQNNYIIHFNCVRCNRKKYKMKKYGKLYCDIN